MVKLLGSNPSSCRDSPVSISSWVRGRPSIYFNVHPLSGAFLPQKNQRSGSSMWGCYTYLTKKIRDLSTCGPPAGEAREFQLHQSRRPQLTQALLRPSGLPRIDTPPVPQWPLTHLLSSGLSDFYWEL